VGCDKEGLHTLTSILKTKATSLITVDLEMPFSPRISGVIRQLMLDHHAPHIHQLRAFAQQTSVIQAGKFITIWQGKSKLHGGRYDWQYSGGGLRRQAAKCEPNHALQEVSSPPETHDCNLRTLGH